MIHSMTYEIHAARANTDWMSLRQMGMHSRLMLFAALHRQIGVPGDARNQLYAAMGDESRNYVADLDAILDQSWHMGADGFWRWEPMVYRTVKEARPARVDGWVNRLSPRDRDMLSRHLTAAVMTHGIIDRASVPFASYRGMFQEQLTN